MSKNKDFLNQEFFGGSSKGSGKGSGKKDKHPASNYVSCHATHPPVPMGPYMVYGGSASFPKTIDADIYVSLQYGSTCGLVGDPWETPDKPVIEVRYTITDQEAPDNLVRFKKMIKWLCNQLQQGKKVHVGCIGGHGRTGTVLAALYKELTGDADAITYIREHYCEKAVETKKQVQFLVDNFGIKAAPARKHHESQGTLGFSEGFTTYSGTGATFDYFSKDKGKKGSKITPLDQYYHTHRNGTRVVMPVPSDRSLWKQRAK